MNRFLADTLSVLNGLFAVLIVAGASTIGYQSSNVGGLILGFFAGIIVAALACGVLAFLALIEGHLNVLAGGKAPKVSARALQERTEPTL